MADFIPTQSPLTETRDFPIETEDLGISQINPLPQQQSPHFNLDNDYYGLSAASNKKQLFIQPNDSVSTRELSEAKTPELAASKNVSSATTTANAKFELNNLYSTIDAILRRSQVMHPKAHTATPTKSAITTAVSQTLTPIRSSSYITSTTRNNFFDSSNPYSKPVSLPTPTPNVIASHQKVKSATATELANIIQSYRINSVRPTTEITYEKPTTVYHLEDIKSQRPSGVSSSTTNFYPSATSTIPIGYDKAKLDQILAKISNSNSSQYAPQPQLKNYSQSSTNFYNASRHWDAPSQSRVGQDLSLNKEYIRESQQQSLNANLYAHSPLEQRFNQPLTQQPKRSAPAPARFNKNSYVGEVQNDDDSHMPEDSVFEDKTLEHIVAPVVVETKPKPQPQIQKFYEEPARPKKLTRRQEILNDKRNSKQSVRRPEEQQQQQQSASKPSSRYQSPNPRDHQERKNNLFVYSPSKHDKNNLFVVSPGKPERNNFLVSPGRESNILASPSRVSATHNKNFGNQRATGGSDISSRFNYVK